MELSIKELVVYTPALNFEVSKSFYTAMGFRLTEAWGGTMDCSLGGAKFRLQNYYNKDWAENFMMRFEVEEVQSWYERVKAMLDEKSYGQARVDEPAMVGDTKIMHVWDPSGVLLIFIQAG